MKPIRDEDLRKGAVEQEAPNQQGNENFAGQNPHRNPSPLAEGQDTDFPEPGQNPEHSGQTGAPDTRGVRVTGSEQISNRNDLPLNTPRGEAKSGATAKRKGETERHKQKQNDAANQDPGERQKRNQGGDKDDPLAA